MRIIFDFWQTLWDPEPQIKELKQVSRETLLSTKQIKEESVILLSKELDGAFFVGVATFLRLLAPYAVFDIATQSDPSFVQRALESWGHRHYFSNIISSHFHPVRDRGRAPSSKKQLLQKHLEGLKQKSIEDVVFIADSSSDAKIAQELGLSFIHKASKGFAEADHLQLKRWIEEGILEGSDPAFLRRFPETLLSSSDFFKIARFMLWRYGGIEQLDFTGRSSSVWGENRELDGLLPPARLSPQKKASSGKKSTM